jgi:hypothetical protein
MKNRKQKNNTMSEYEIASFSSLVVIQGINKSNTEENAQTISDINKQKEGLKSELKRGLALI